MHLSFFTLPHTQRASLLLSSSLLLALCTTVACGDSSDNTQPSTTTQTTEADAGTDTQDDTANNDTDTGPPEPIPDGALKINEVAAAGTPSDWFELFNTTDTTLDLSTVYFTDRLADEPKRSPFPPGTTIDPGGFLVIYMDDSFPGFGLGSDEELALVAEDDRVLDAVDWDRYQSPVGGSFGRIADGVGDFKILRTPTPGAANQDNPGGGQCGDGARGEGEACDDGNLEDGDGCDGLCQEEVDPVCGNNIPEEGEECDDGNLEDGDGCSAQCKQEATSTAPVVINEVVSFPEEGASDWVEFVNVSSDPVDLTGWFFSDSDPTHIALFESGTTLQPGAFLVVERVLEGAFTFGLGVADEVLLYNAEGTLVDRTGWEDGDAPQGSSWGRSPSGTGSFSTQTPPTRAESNP